MSLLSTPTGAESRIQNRQRIAAALLPHLTTIRYSADPSFSVTWALSDAGLDAGFEVATEPLRGPVLRALGRAWHWAATCTPETSAPGVLRVARVEHGEHLVQWHGAEATLIARAGGAALCIVDGERPDVVDVSYTNLVDLLVAALIRASASVPAPLASSRTRGSASAPQPRQRY